MLENTLKEATRKFGAKHQQSQVSTNVTLIKSKKKHQITTKAMTMLLNFLHDKNNALKVTNELSDMLQLWIKSLNHAKGQSMRLVHFYNTARDENKNNNSMDSMPCAFIEIDINAAIQKIQRQLTHNIHLINMPMYLYCMFDSNGSKNAEMNLRLLHSGIELTHICVGNEDILKMYGIVVALTQELHYLYAGGRRHPPRDS